MNFKKLLAAGSAAALMACASFTAFASAPTVSIDNKEAKKGDKVTVTVKMNSDNGADSLMGNVSVSGLTVDSATGGVSTTGKVGLANGIGTTATYVCTVTAGEGESYSFTLTNMTEADLETNTETALANAAVSGKVPAAATSTPTTDTPGTDAPSTDAPATSAPAPGTTPTADGTVVEKPAEGKAPRTGDIGAVQLIRSLFN